MELFIRAFILALVFEGLCFAIFPELMRKAMLEAAAQNNQMLRYMGGLAIVSAMLLAFIFGLF